MALANAPTAGQRSTTGGAVRRKTYFILSIKEFFLSYLILVFGVCLVVADFVFQWLWYSAALSQTTASSGGGVETVKLFVDGHINPSVIPIIPHPATIDSFLVSIVVTAIYHILVNIFTIAYWIRSNDSPYIKFGGEEVNTETADTQALFGKILFLDLDKYWSPRFRHASIIYWLVAPWMLLRHCKIEAEDPLFRLQALNGGAGIGFGEVESDSNSEEGDDDEEMQRSITSKPQSVISNNVNEQNPLYRLRKAQMSLSYRYNSVFIWTMFRFFWFFYVPPVTALGHIRFAALIIAYNRAIHTFGTMNTLVVTGLIWSVIMMWLLAAIHVLVWFIGDYLHFKFTVFWQRRKWNEHRVEIAKQAVAQHRRTSSRLPSAGGKKLKRNQVQPI